MKRPLSPAQIRALSIEARKAWAALSEATRADVLECARYALADEDAKLTAASTAVFDWWRRSEQAQICKHTSLSEFDNTDFDRMKAHWLDLQGLQKPAWVAQSQADPRRLRHLIREACASAGLPEAYAQTICRDKSHGATLDEAHAADLRKVLYTLNNRLRKSARSTTPRKPKDWDRERANRHATADVYARNKRRSSAAEADGAFENPF
jgi:hypothetical protein